METNKHILVVDDDTEILALLEEVLKAHGYKTSTAQTGQDMLDALAKGSYDLLLLDVMLPDADGINLCQNLRKESNIPIILFTANTCESDRVIGLEFGADDYIQKPFNPRELVARIKSLLKRIEVYSQHVPEEIVSSKARSYRFRGWTLNETAHQLYSPDGVEVPITHAGYELLLAFVEHPQRVLSRDFLFNLTKNRDGAPSDRSIDILVSRLRQKFEEDPKNPTLIKTIRNGGYMFTEKVELV